MDLALSPIFAIALGPEWIIVAGIVVLLFGGSQIPKLARSLGQASKEFKDGQTDEEKAEAAAKDAKGGNAAVAGDSKAETKINE